MRILLMAPHPFYQNRGTPIAVRLMAETLGMAGYDIHLLCFHEGEEVTLPRTTIHRIPNWFGIHGVRPGFSGKKLLCDMLMFLQAWHLMARLRFDMIHAVEESVFIAIIFKWFRRIPFIYDMDSSLPQQLNDKYHFLGPLRPMMNLFERLAVDQSEGVIAVCNALERIAHAYTDRDRVLKLEDISMIDRWCAEAGDAMHSINVPNRTVIMYVGNLEEYQGIDLLLEGLKILVQRRPEAFLVVVGGAADDIHKYTLMAESLGISKNVKFLGPHPVEQLGSFLRNADLLVSPRLKGQNTPMKLYSYMDSGKPIVATRLETHTQVLDDETAMLVEPTSHAMAAGMEHVMATPEKAVEMAVKAKERVKLDYSYPTFQAKLLKYYQSIAKRLAPQ